MTDSKLIGNIFWQR